MIASRRPCPTVARHLGACALFVLGAAASPSAAIGAVGAAVTPTPLGNPASASPAVAPAVEPQTLVLQAPAAGSAAPAAARGEGKVAADRPATFLFAPTQPSLFSISVASPQNAARLSVYLGEATAPEVGTTAADGAIRWSSELAAGERVKIVVHTTGSEIPFRVEVLAGAGGI